MLSTFETALLDRHLRGCAACRAFAAGADEQTRLLRDAVLEQPARPVLIPEELAPSGSRRVAAVLSACLVAGAAAAVLVWPGTRTTNAGQTPQRSGRVGAPVMVMVASQPTANATLVVPRLRMRPASIADGPLHGYFGQPV